MAAIRLIGFSGEQPRVVPRLMPDTGAQVARNVRLDDGALTPIRRRAFVTDGDAEWHSMMLHLGSWIGWDTVVNAVAGPVADDRLYFTGDGVPKMMVGEDTFPLTVPRPTGALTATPTGSGSGDAVSRIYVYTYVTGYGEELEPCAVSNTATWQPGQEVVLSGFATPPTDRAIATQRIYRSQTGRAGTYFYLIAERSASNGDFTDDVEPDAFQEALPSEHWTAPPDDLEGLIALPNGMMAAFVGRDVYFCEPWRPHAWPQRYVITTDVNIVGLGAMGNQVLVMTEGQPYMIAGTAPENMVASKIEQNLPCINARGIVDLGYAIAYPSHEGLVVAQAGGGFVLATANIFNRDGWQALSPSTMIAAQYSGRYAAFYETSIEGEEVSGLLLIDLTAQSFLIRADQRADAVFHDLETGHLYFLDDGDIWLFDAPGARPEMLRWRSKQFVLPSPVNMAAILIDGPAGALAVYDHAGLTAAIQADNAALFASGLNGAIDDHTFDEVALGGDGLQPLPEPDILTVAVQVIADGRTVATVTRRNEIQRLPSGFLARTWEIDVRADLQVQAVTIATSVDELKEVA